MLLFVVYLIICNIILTFAQWEFCDCLNNWEPWSDCVFPLSGSCIADSRLSRRKRSFENIPTCPACEPEYRECENPCKNAALNFDHLMCYCLQGYTGECCEHNVTCERPQEIDHGSYKNKLDFYVYQSDITYSCDTGYKMTDPLDAWKWCTETGQWSGILPECLYAESCKSNPCENDGTCTNLLGNYTCSCTTGWSGKRCDIDADLCKSNPCENDGTCTNLLGNYNCSCITGWSGKRCDTAVTCGRPREITNGRYHSNFDNYVYQSEITYTCDQGYNMTDPSDAKNWCLGNGYWSGKLPECLYAESCKSNPCENDGTCTNLLGNYTCSCTTGWSGKRCDTAVTCGRPREITNGRYHSNFDNYVYQSEITYTCDQGYNMTDPSDAKNWCLGNGYWSEKLPECLYAESCESNPCHNNGTCTNLLGNYTCACATGWSGKHCSKVEDVQRGDLEWQNSSYTVAVVGGALGTFCFALIIALIVVIVRRRRKSDVSQQDEYTTPNFTTVETEGYSTIDISRDTASGQNNNTYENERILPF
ncbi:sushi, nidogen and EGF-like domain-containing protein 1 [Mercenaria mercenaria]|uniref:sushi, nidogen and EGF-like domain-containing protein 1 n=1 Tax=Mercenaria mercenaria TaxID=6596 RepID=UPI00234E4A0E|nr:sushi, nidogen and EGF-like domain-containing protein 1 [Mercenaria mercenaria]